MIQFDGKLFAQEAAQEIVQATETSVFKKKINLEDVSIKGEVNKGGNLLSKRSKVNLDERIKIPRDFNKAILEHLDPALDGISTLDTKK